MVKFDCNPIKDFGEAEPDWDLDQVKIRDENRDQDTDEHTIISRQTVLTVPTTCQTRIWGSCRYEREATYTWVGASKKVCDKLRAVYQGRIQPSSKGKGVTQARFIQDWLNTITIVRQRLSPVGGHDPHELCAAELKSLCNFLSKSDLIHRIVCFK
ncbi:hypothetical protein EVAR_63293_1 [Eumeta japonica]|uniref:Uncharacterized protein n=1 Tax=Eumeta variegata TaxID=151549 RepID=A0A4C1ZNN2_EUMVA|nr:hypothetical protein EVAR_63293_1 [Eumeta japonica]